MQVKREKNHARKKIKTKKTNRQREVISTYSVLNNSIHDNMEQFMK